MATILVVDDDLTASAMLCDALLDAGHLVFSVPDHHEALIALRTVKIDLVLWGLAVPRAHGDAFATGLRADPRTAHVPLVVLRGAADQTALPADSAFRLLEKPVALPALLEAV